MSILEIPGVQNPVVKHARATGWLAWKMKIEGRNGCPDYWFFKDGVLRICEFKRPGGTLSAQQERRIRELRDQGFDVYVINDIEGGMEMLK